MLDLALFLKNSGEGGEGRVISRVTSNDFSIQSLYQEVKMIGQQPGRTRGWCSGMLARVSTLPDPQELSITWR